jgi:hypothetical protein
VGPVKMLRPQVQVQVPQLRLKKSVYLLSCCSNPTRWICTVDPFSSASTASAA